MPQDLRLLEPRMADRQPIVEFADGRTSVGVTVSVGRDDPRAGTPTRTTHRRIVTDKFTIDLWYTLNGSGSACNPPQKTVGPFTTGSSEGTMNPL